MLRKKRLLKAELLEPRLALSGMPWFEDSGQQPGINSFGVPLGDLDGDGDLDAFVSCFSGGDWSGACREARSGLMTEREVSVRAGVMELPRAARRSGGRGRPSQFPPQRTTSG